MPVSLAVNVTRPSATPEVSTASEMPPAGAGAESATVTVAGVVSSVSAVALEGAKKTAPPVTEGGLGSSSSMMVMRCSSVPAPSGRPQSVGVDGVRSVLDRRRVAVSLEVFPSSSG